MFYVDWLTTDLLFENFESFRKIFVLNVIVDDSFVVLHNDSEINQVVLIAVTSNQIVYRFSAFYQRILKN